MPVCVVKLQDAAAERSGYAMLVRNHDAVVVGYARAGDLLEVPILRLRRRRWKLRNDPKRIDGSVENRQVNYVIPEIADVDGAVPSQTLLDLQAPFLNLRCEVLRRSEGYIRDEWRGIAATRKDLIKSRVRRHRTIEEILPWILVGRKESRAELLAWRCNGSREDGKGIDEGRVDRHGISDLDRENVIENASA